MKRNQKEAARLVSSRETAGPLVKLFLSGHRHRREPRGPLLGPDHHAATVTTAVDRTVSRVRVRPRGYVGASGSLADRNAGHHCCVHGRALSSVGVYTCCVSRSGKRSREFPETSRAAPEAVPPRVCGRSTGSAGLVPGHPSGPAPAEAPRRPQGRSVRGDKLRDPEAART